MQRILLTIFCIVCAAACTTAPSQHTHSEGNNMAFDTVKYVKEFPIRYRLDKGTPYDPDIIGVQDFLIHDTMMIFSTNDPSGYWAFLSMPQQKLCGRSLQETVRMNFCSSRM